MKRDMENKVTLKTSDGIVIEFWDEMIQKRGTKEIYMGIGNIFVVEIFCNPLSEKEKNDLIQIVQTYNSKEKDMKDVLQGWPSNIVEWKGKVGVVIPFRDQNQLNCWLSTWNPFK
jgi:hypothetical protein